MPTTFQLVETTFPNGEGKTTQEQINGVYDYLFVLLEQLRYTLFNLDESNLNQNALSEFIKNISEPIYAKIDDTDKNVNEISITAQGLAARISNAEGTITQIGVTVNGLQTIVSGKIDGSQAQTLIDQSLSGITLAATSNGSGTIFQISKDGAVLASTGRVDICVDAVNVYGTLTAGAVCGDTIAIKNEAGSTVGGITTAYTTGGIGMGILTMTGGMQIQAAGNIYIASQYNTRLQLDSDAAKIGPTVWATDGSIIYSSDRSVKNSIGYDLSAYRQLLLDLKPCRYKYNAGQSGRYHIGLIAQDVEQSLADNDLTPDDFAGWCKMPVRDEDGNITGYTYGIRYDDIIPLNTMMIQELEQRVKALEVKLTKEAEAE